MTSASLSGIEAVAIPPVRFWHHGHELEVGLFPSPAGNGYEMLIADSGGVLLVQGLNTWMPATAVKTATNKARGMLLELRNWVHRYVAGLDEATFRQLLATPRHRPEFRWTAEKVEAVKRIDWEQPAATFTHHSHRFSVGHCSLPGGVLVVLRDQHGVFDGSVSLAGTDIAREAMQGRDLVAQGVAAMQETIEAKSAAEVTKLVRSGARMPATANSVH